MSAPEGPTAGAPRRSRRSRRPRLLPSVAVAYAATTGVLGAATGAAVVAASPPLAAVAADPVPLVVLALALVLGELVPVPVTRGDDTISPVTISTTFAVALLLLAPLSWVLLVHTAAVVLDDARTARRPLQVLFNAGQYVLSLVAARAVLGLLTGAPLLGTPSTSGAAGLLAALAAGLTFALVNDGLVAVVAALSTRRPVLAVLTEDIRFKLETSGVLIALGPIAALLAGTSVLMLPLLVLPVLAVRRTALTAALRERQSLHDPLTGLANRALFGQRLDQAIVGQGDRGLAVMMLDLDHFKDVNDVLGHHVGDELLQQVAGRISACVQRAGGEVAAEVARLGGDEFAVLLVAVDPARAASALAVDLLAAFAVPVEIAGSRLAIDTSIGITTTAAGPLPDGSTALQQADIALYDAKLERARASTYSPLTMSGSAERLELLPDLRAAVETEQLTVLYQPQVRVGDQQVVAVEALVRWDHPTRGRLGPDAFIALAESTGLITRITTIVLEQAVRACAAWAAGGSPIGVSVNLSARQLSDRSLPEHVAALLAASGAPRGALTVEVTESSLMADPRAARSILSELREMGVQLAIDDFGTGYSSLALLQQLEVDELKVDRSFVSGLTSGGNDEILVRSTIDLAHNLGLRVVAEGVESSEIAHRLGALGCDLLQGYRFGRPMERAGITALLASQRSAAALGAATATDHADLAS